MIYCIWYPSGGFGHFVNAIISSYGRDFSKLDNNQLKFSSTGDIHQYILAAPKYLHDPENYQFDFDESKNYTVLIDNGINNQNDKFKNVFPHAKVIKICYSDHSWPIVARTMIEKAMQVNFDLEISIDKECWPDYSQWAYREKYFLFLRDHELRSAWKSNHTDINLHVDDLLDYLEFYNKIQQIGEINPFEDDWNNWRVANKSYIDPISIANDVMKSIRTRQSLPIDTITDIWTQSVVYSYIWLEYNFEVPHNDYSEWFTNTTDIVRMLKNYNIIR